MEWYALEKRCGARYENESSVDNVLCDLKSINIFHDIGPRRMELPVELSGETDSVIFVLLFDLFARSIADFQVSDSLSEHKLFFLS